MNNDIQQSQFLMIYFSVNIYFQSS